MKAMAIGCVALLVAIIAAVFSHEDVCKSGTEESEAEVHGLEISAFDGAAYATVQNGGQWRIGIVNHAERLSPREVPLRIERHLTSEESFVLLEGKGELVFGEKRPFTHVPLESGKVYTVKRGVWHAVMTVPGAKIMVVEDADVSDANTERKVPGPAGDGVGGRK